MQAVADRMKQGRHQEHARQREAEHGNRHQRNKGHLHHLGIVKKVVEYSDQIVHGRSP